MPKQLINICGALITLVVLALGIVLGALPQFSESQTTTSRADQVKQTNDAYATQVQVLRAQEAKIDELDAQLAQLQAAIPTNELNDQVFEMVVAAAAATNSQIVLVTASEYTPWTPPAPATSVTVDGVGIEIAADEPAATPAGDEADEAGGDGPIADANDVADAATDAGGITAQAPVDAAIPGRYSVPFEVTVVSPDPASAMAFVDLVNAGTRLVGIENVVFNVTTPLDAIPLPTEDGAPVVAATPTQLTVTMHSLVYVGK